MGCLFFIKKFYRRIDMNTLTNYCFNYLLLIVFSAIPLSGVAQLNLSGEFRPRTEFRNGYRTLHTAQDDPAFFTSQRTRISLLFNDDLYLFKLSAQDIRTWGDEAQIQDNANTNIHEAWAELNVAKHFKVKLGRQELVYDDQRLLGSVNWTQPGRSHDAIVLKYQNNATDFHIHFGGAYNQENEKVLGNTYTLNNYKTLSYMWMNKKFGPLDVSGVLLADGFELASGNTNYRYTYGSFMNYKVEDLLVSGTIYLQRGDDNSRSNISAYMLAGKASYMLKNSKISVGIDYLSGGKVDDANPARHSFNTLYATNHKFYGNMDYFLNIPNETKGGGLQDFYVSLEHKASSKVMFNITYHYFALAQKVSDPTNSLELLNKALASEFDISSTYTISEDAKLVLGYSTLFSSDSLERLQQRTSEGMQQWGWVMLVLTPEFFSSE
jgi:hypothetical protein